MKKERHPRESGDPEILVKTLDSRFRGNDKFFFNQHIQADTNRMPLFAIFIC